MIDTYGLCKKAWGVRIVNSSTNTALLWKGLRMRFNDLCGEHKMRTEESHGEVTNFLTWAGTWAVWKAESIP